jgi:F-type H+-transporting ATPase subunit alpha
VGGKAQIPAMKKVAGGLRLDLAAFRELEAFAQLGTDLDPATQSRLDRGYRMIELLKQPLYNPMHVIDEVLSIYAGTRGHLDKVPRTEVREWEKGFLKFVHEKKQAFWEKLAGSKKLDDASAAELEKVIAEFQQVYASQKKHATTSSEKTVAKA